MSTPPTPDLPTEAAAAVARLNDLIDGKTPEPDVRVTPNALALRLLTGRECLPPDQAQRLLATLHAAAITDAADALDAQSCTCGCRRAVEFLRTCANPAATAPTATTETTDAHRR